MSDYPTLMYRCPGPHFAHDGQTYEYCGVVDEQQQRELAIQGWCLTLTGAVEAVTATQKAEEAQEESSDRAELESMANELGIKFDGRTTYAALLRKIEAATGGE